MSAEWLFLVAAVLHLLAVPDHDAVWRGYSVFFVLVAVGQGLYSVLLPRLLDRRWFMLTGIVATAGLLALWLLTRLWHTPVGPHRLHAEPFGVLDLTVAVVEIAAAFCLAEAFPRSARRPGARSSLIPESAWT